MPRFISAQTWTKAMRLVCYRRLIIALAMLLVLMGSPSQPPIQVWAYSCPYHCYSQNLWTLGYPGVKTAINLSHLTAPNPGGSSGFITNEEWLTDSSELHWVENGTFIGVAQGTNKLTCNSQCYFWADQRPGDANTNLHFFANVGSGDYGNNVTFQINQSGTNNYAVAVFAPSGTYTSNSTSNTMTANDEIIGGELDGASGGSAGNATYNYNSYYVPRFGFTYFSTNGSTNIQSPPWTAGWTTPPTSSQTGGTWHTSCGCS